MKRKLTPSLKGLPKDFVLKLYTHVVMFATKTWERLSTLRESAKPGPVSKGVGLAKQICVLVHSAGLAGEFLPMILNTRSGKSTLHF